MAPTESVEGYWGRQTATIDWCERNYEVTYYVAEWWNTITNILIIIYASWGIYEVLSQGFKKRFLVLYVLMYMVGVGSWLFHMTLLYSSQLFDELPMVYFALFNCYCLVEIPHPENQHFLSNKPLFLFLFGFSIFFTVSYLFWPQPLLHEFVFAALIFGNWYQQGKIVSRSACKSCRRFQVGSFCSLLFAFLLWNIDTVFCSTLENIRTKAPFGVGPLTQLHGWWHLLGAFFGRFQVALAIHAWYDFHKEKEETRKLDIVPGGFKMKRS